MLRYYVRRVQNAAATVGREINQTAVFMRSPAAQSV
jgi:hypothetical protein